MQNCMGELNLIYCLIYLDDLIVFSWTVEEHLHWLHVVFNWLREYNLKLKSFKCSLFKEEINYLAHQVSKQGVRPSDTNLKALTDFAPPQTYTEIWAFLGLVGHYRWFIKGFVQITQPLNEHLAREGASGKSEWVSLFKSAPEAFQALKQACMNSPVLDFTNYLKDFLPKTAASREGLGAVLSQKQVDGQFHPVAYGSQALTAHKKNYHSTKLEFLALKWAVTEHFKEYLLYQPFLVKTNNNPLTNIITSGGHPRMRGGGMAPNSSVNVTHISKQYFILGWPDGSLQAGDQDSKWKGELSSSSGSCRSFTLWVGTSAWPSAWRLTPDILSTRLLDLAAIDTKLVAVN